MNTIIIVYITTPTLEVAESISHLLLEKKMIACANILSAKSMYWWENAIQSAQEAIIIAKTVEDCFAQLEKEVISIHPYKVPCILKIPAQAHEPFAQWMKQELNR